MADKFIDELTVVTTFTDDDYFLIDNDPAGTTEDVVISGANLRNTLASGNVGFSAHQTSAQVNIATSTNTPVIYETETKDTHNFYDTTTGKFTPTGGAAGTYRLTATCSISSLGDGKSVWIGLRKNGDNSKLYWGSAQVIGAAASPEVSVSKNFYLDGVDDYVEAIVWHNNGSNRDTSPGSAAGWICYFEGIRVGNDDLCGI